MQIGVSLAVSGLFLYLAARGVHWRQVTASLSAADYRYVVPITLVSIYSLYVRCLRWRLLLERAAGRRVSMEALFSATAIGFMSNLVLPLRIGEVVRPYLLSHKTRVPLSTTLATAVLERVLDMAALVVLLLVVIASSEASEALKQISIYAGVFAGVGFAFVFFAHRHKETVLPFLDRIWRRAPGVLGDRLVRLEHEFFDGVGSIADARVLLVLLGWSVFLWLVIALTFYLGTIALGIRVGFLGGGVAVATVVALAVALPSAPGFVGVFQVGCTTALAMYGVGRSQALAFSLFAHATVYISQLPIGLVYLLREGLSFAKLEEIEAEAKRR